MWSSLLDMTMNKRASHLQVCHNGLNHIDVQVNLRWLPVYKASLAPGTQLPSG